MQFKICSGLAYLHILFVFLRCILLYDIVSILSALLLLARLLSTLRDNLGLVLLLWLTFSAHIPEVLDDGAHDTANLLLIATT